MASKVVPFLSEFGSLHQVRSTWTSGGVGHAARITEARWPDSSDSLAVPMRDPTGTDSASPAPLYSLGEQASGAFARVLEPLCGSGSA